MHISFRFQNRTCSADLGQPIDVSLAVADITRAWYIAPPRFEPVRLGENWVGSIEAGAPVNFFDIHFNPHAHGTHTECMGHVTRQHHSVNQALQGSWFMAELVSIPVTEVAGDLILSRANLEKRWNNRAVQALVLRTNPNQPEKTNSNLSGTNWPYLEASAAELIRECGVEHLLIDQPSVDREEDGGALAAHKAFWGLPHNPRPYATITELIFVPDNVPDGLYLLNLQVAPLENDASPSRPVLYALQVV